MDQNWILRERRSGAFYRTVTLPTPVNADQAQARFEHGVLHLTLPKAEEAKPRQIRIGDGGPGSKPPVGDPPTGGLARQIPMQGTSAPQPEQTH